MRKAVRVDDVDVSYEVTGSGAAVLCVQGVGVPGSGWRPQVAALSARFTVITYDNRGLGRTAPSSTPLTIEAMAADAAAILDAEGLDRCHVVGHSMGGLIAQHVALTHPRRVTSLSLLCTFATGRDATALSLRMLVLGVRSRIGTRAMRRNGMLNMILPDAYLRGADRRRLAGEFEDLFGRDLADQPPIVRQQLRAMSRYDAAPRLPELSAIPTLVISGRHDPIAPPRLGRAIASAAKARFVEMTVASHALPIQCAAETNTLLLDHLISAEAAATAATAVRSVI